MMADPWAKQSASLIKVQKEGGSLEKEICEILGWSGGRVIYDGTRGYSIQVDSAFPTTKNPLSVVSVTYTDPDTKGHSNENKFQLKLGELTLLKAAYPVVRMVLVIGGSRDAWLPYVLEGFQYFFDEVLFLWRTPDINRLRMLRDKPDSVSPRNEELWKAMRDEWSKIKFWPPGRPVPQGLVRYQILDALRAQTPRVTRPELIVNPIARLCLQKSFEHRGTEWRNYLEGRWGSIEMSRNYFNPVEAEVEISLAEAGLQFKGGIAQNVEVRSFLHDLGMKTTKVAEDFVLFSDRLKKHVYIQCKSSGGGRDQHGKNIQNRTKEQIARQLIYRCRLQGKKIVLGTKDYHSIAIVDGDWAVTKAQPAKYIHMLQLAGYDYVLCAADLLTSRLEVKRGDNPLVRYAIDELDCVRS